MKMIQLTKILFQGPYLGTSLLPGHSTCQYFDYLILSAFLNIPYYLLSLAQRKDKI